MATIVARPASLTKTSTPPTPSLSLNTSIRGTPIAIPNKHLPTCSPGPRPAGHRLSSPQSPSLPPVIDTTSLLHPPDQYLKLSPRSLVYALNANQLHAALDHIACQPIPDPKNVFPWLHGLHADNNVQLAFFIARKKASRRQPKCIRSITIVKVGGDLTHSKLKGAIAPNELLRSGNMSSEPQFVEADPRDGFSVRNFQIQAAKMATISDVVVYGDDKTSQDEVRDLAETISRAQRAWRDKDRDLVADRPLFSTFILTDTFSKVEEDHSGIVAIGSNSCLTGNVIDFFHSERVEMQTMSTASEIAKNIWLGPSPDTDATNLSAAQKEEPLPYDLLIECNELAQIPKRNAFTIIEELLATDGIAETAVPQLDFPGSGSIMPPTWSQQEADGLMATVAWIHTQANGLHSGSRSRVGADAARKRKDSRACFPDRDNDNDIAMDIIDEPRSQSPGRKILLHCSDGYTETTLLAIAYYMYANCVPIHQAYIELHCRHKRNFFAYPTDVALLTSIQPRILQASPACKGYSLSELNPPSPMWMSKLDGSLPSRITPYMYLGNLNHANNPGLLKELGIGQVLSVGESVDWTKSDMVDFCDGGLREWDGSNKGRWMYVDGVQDNGVDPLSERFSKCLDFIRQGRQNGTATLVHCRVGVSRSATICIAEAMNEFGLSFPSAYCYVRARRLNVIIQPHLRFSYELLKYEEYQAMRRGKPLERELEWATIAREIAAMNRPYSRQ